MRFEAIAERFWSDGVVTIRGFFDAARLIDLEQALARYLRDVVPTLKTGQVFFEDPPSRTIKSLFGMHTRDDAFAQLSCDARLVALMRIIFPEGDVTCDDVGFFGKAARDGSTTPPHQDNGFNHLEPPFCLKASIALDAATPANGAMRCQIGSHRLGLLPHKPSGVMGFSQTLVQELSTADYPEVSCCMEPGDLTLHHTNTVHRSDGNPSSRSRRMLSLIYRSSLAVRNEAKYQAVEAARARLYMSRDGALARPTTS